MDYKDGKSICETENASIWLSGSTLRHEMLQNVLYLGIELLKDVLKSIDR